VLGYQCWRVSRADFGAKEDRSSGPEGLNVRARELYFGTEERGEKSACWIPKGLGGGGRGFLGSQPRGGVLRTLFVRRVPTDYSTVTEGGRDLHDETRTALGFRSSEVVPRSSGTAKDGRE